MILSQNENPIFKPVLDHVNGTFNNVICSGASTLIIHKDSIVLEQYIGKQSGEREARAVQADTQFHVASVRKSYIGFAVSYAMFYGYITNIDDLVLTYLPELGESTWQDTTIRHLLTHTHGLKEQGNRTTREFSPGSNWSYKQIGVEVLTQIVKRTTNKSVAEIIHENVFIPLGFTESNWYSKKHKKLVDVMLRYEGDEDWRTSDSTDGDKMNMYVSTRELAYWGYFHLKRGKVNGKQIVPREIIDMATSLQSPSTLHNDLPQNGFLWFVKDSPAKKTEIGHQVPKGSFQILGFTNVTLLVIPEEDIVAVRMFNSFGSPEGYDYLSDVRSFGDSVMKCVKNESKVSL
ncbi:serine hydrolase domain-containing protein [Rossellomorea sp. YZS02]|uniref:serine hydrolase domain-containing protein n=1 Tax=Rossellomorea sp. YZS02 TaxID=3097358 RepID=UPI002A167F33|nr:serine hydrolase domain-containing protein [Rossellomorea sp. YZS02]MDX8342251.1 serine hydrolase domain-containing protein [Rossellomorea sp. YZS02]